MEIDELDEMEAQKPATCKFFNNEVVSKCADPKSCGLVKKIHRKSDAVILPEALYSVLGLDTQRLESISPFSFSMSPTYVYHNGWIGEITDVKTCLLFSTEDGSEFSVDNSALSALTMCIQCQSKSYHKVIVTFGHTMDLIVGQKVKISWSALNKSNWLKKSPSHNEEFVQERVEKCSQALLNLGIASFSASNLNSLKNAMKIWNNKETCTECDGIIEEKSHKIPAESAQEKATSSDKSEYPKIRISACEHMPFDAANITEIDKENVSLDVDSLLLDATLLRLEVSSYTCHPLHQVLSTADQNGENALNSDDFRKIENLCYFRVPYEYATLQSTLHRAQLNFELDQIVPVEKPLSHCYYCKQTFGDNVLEKADDKQLKKESISTEATMTTSVDSEDQMETSKSHAVSEKINFNEPVYLSEFNQSCTFDILWEDGVYEKNMEAADLMVMPKTTGHQLPEYFPAMYVYVSGSVGKMISESKMGDSADLQDQLLKRSNHFGIIRKADNAQKYALVDFYLFNRVEYKKNASLEPKFLRQENVSFYDLKDCRQYNYFKNCMVELIHVPKEKSGEPNFGIVSGKQLDGTVALEWFTGKEEKSGKPIFQNAIYQPWMLRQLDEANVCAARMLQEVEERMYGVPMSQDAAYGAYYKTNDDDADSSDVSIQQDEKSYSPSEHEFEAEVDAIDMSNLDMVKDERDKRLGIASGILFLVAQRIIKCVHLSRMLKPQDYERSKLLAATRSAGALLSVAHSLASLTNGCMKEVIKGEMNFLETHLTEAQQKAATRYHASESDTIDYIMISTVIDTLLDFGETMSMFCADMERYRSKLSQASEATATPVEKADAQEFKSAQVNTATAATRKKSAVETCYRSPGERKTSAAMTNDILERQGFNERLKAFLENEETNSPPATTDTCKQNGTMECDDSSELVLSTGSSTSSQSQTSLEILCDLDQQLKLVKSGATLAISILRALPSESITCDAYFDYKFACEEKPIEEKYLKSLASAEECIEYLSMLFVQSKPLRFLPWFSYFRPRDFEMAQMVQLWFSDRVQDPKNDYDSNRIVMENSRMLKEHFESGKKSMPLVNNDILLIGNNVGDAFCLAVACQLLRTSQIMMTSFEKHLEMKPVENAIKPSETTDENGKIESNCTGDQKNENQDNDQNMPEENLIISVASVQDSQQFKYLPKAPESHKFYQKKLNSLTNLPKSYLGAVRRDAKLLSTCLTPGIFIRLYEDRIDLISCMIIGPEETPYANVPFLFDVRLHDSYPTKPPHVFFKSMSKCLNPNLYENGMVCLSLLGTWDGKETELWNSSSTLLQVFLSIQSLILVSEPYFNEPGYEMDAGSVMGSRNSRDYNENAILRSLETYHKTLLYLQEPFVEEIVEHTKNCYPKFENLLKNYRLEQKVNCDENNSETKMTSEENQGSSKGQIGFELWPVTIGFKITIASQLKRLLDVMRKSLESKDTEMQQDS